MHTVRMIYFLPFVSPEEFNLDLRIEHCTEGHLIADELAGHGLKVSVGPTLTRRSKVELKNKTWIHLSRTSEKRY